MPYGKDVNWVSRVILDIRNNVYDAGSNDCSADYPKYRGGQPLVGESVVSQPSVEITVGKIEGYCEPDPVGVDL